MKSTSAKSGLFMGLLVSVALDLVFGMPRHASAEMPAGLEKALASYQWIMPFKKPTPLRFQPDGTVMDSTGSMRFKWNLDKTSGTVHMVGLDKKPEQYSLWLDEDLMGFSWYESRYQNSGVGTRGEQVAPVELHAAASPPKIVPPPKQIQPLLEPCLNAILAPLETNPAMPRVAVDELRAAFGGGAVKAKTPIAKTDLSICDGCVRGADEWHG